MPNIPVRGVGATGIVTDQSPYDLDLSGWSDGRNVRFAGGKVSRYSILKDAYPEHVQDHVSSDNIPVGGGVFITPSAERPYYVTQAFSVISPNADGTEEDYTPLSGLPSSSSLRCTSAFIGGVSYLNRGDAVPMYMTPSSTEFAVVPSWDATYRAKSVRRFGDYLFALNVTKGGTANPNLFAWSDTIQYGTVADFDLLAPGTNAGEDVLNDAQSGIVDGWPLRNSFVIYTSTDVHMVNYIGGDFLFEHSQIFGDDGIMAVNCVVEVENKHFCFGNQDIYIHDGITKKSITDELVKKYLFSMINFDQKDRCFVYHDSEHSEVGFAFNTLIDEATESPSGDCNMAAVYNYAAGTWTFVDLPSGVAPLRLSVNAAAIWEDLDPTWEELDSAWTSFGGSSTKNTSMVSAGFGTSDTRPRLIMLDDPLTGRLTQPPVTAYQYDAFVERTGLDLDNIGAEIIGRKTLRRMMPQVRTPDTEAEFFITLGQGKYSGSTVDWGVQKSFNPYTQYKIDARNNGRYLAMRFEAPSGHAFELSGYDLDIVLISRR